MAIGIGMGIDSAALCDVNVFGSAGGGVHM